MHLHQNRVKKLTSRSTKIVKRRIKCCNVIFIVYLSIIMLYSVQNPILSTFVTNFEVSVSIFYITRLILPSVTISKSIHFKSKNFFGETQTAKRRPLMAKWALYYIYLQCKVFFLTSYTDKKQWQQMNAKSDTKPTNTQI